MRLTISEPLWLFVLSAPSVFATFEDFSFAGNRGNSSAARTCGTGTGSLPYGCDPPSMCSQDTLSRKWYCCAPGQSDAICWNGASKCDGAATGTASTVPSAQQTGCTVGNVNFCCTQNEKCTEIVGQFNICWSKFDNPLSKFNKTRLNETFQSLSRASPSAVSYTVDRAELNGYTSTTPGASTATSTTTSVRPSSTSPSTSTTSAPPSAGGLSGGAIGGIVGGVIGGLALLGLAGFFLWRRKRAQGKTDPHAPASDPYSGYGYQSQQQYQPQQSYTPSQQYSPQPPAAQMHSPPPSDKYAHMHQPHVAEAPAFSAPAEMDASYQQQQSGHGIK